jgi:hypothetical protein
MVAHALSPRVPAPARLRSLVAALHGRLAVVNPSNAARLPMGLVSAVQGLVRIGFDGEVLLAKDARDPLGLDPSPRAQSSVRREADARATYERLRVGALLNALPSSTRERLAEGVDWAVVALYESTIPTVRFTTSFGSDASTDSPTVVAVAEIGYRVVITAGTTVSDRAFPGDREAMDRLAVAPGGVVPPRGRRPGSGVATASSRAGRSARAAGRCEPAVVRHPAPRPRRMALDTRRSRNACALGTPNGPLRPNRSLLVPRHLGSVPRAGAPRRVAHRERCVAPPPRPTSVRRSLCARRSGRRRSGQPSPTRNDAHP